VRGARWSYAAAAAGAPAPAKLRRRQSNKWHVVVAWSRADWGAQVVVVRSGGWSLPWRCQWRTAVSRASREKGRPWHFRLWASVQGLPPFITKVRTCRMGARRHPRQPARRGQGVRCRRWAHGALGKGAAIGAGDRCVRPTPTRLPHGTQTCGIRATGPPCRDAHGCQSARDHHPGAPKRERRPINTTLTAIFLEILN
jgi:hypothetical protein